MSVDWQGILKQTAPWVAAAASGPAGLIGMAASQLSQYLGTSVQPNSESIQAAIAGATPEQMIALKNADNDFAKQMQAMGFANIEALQSIAAGDRASARGMQIATQSNMPAIITMSLITMWAIFEGAILLGVEPRIAPELVGGVLRTLDNLLMVAVAFWFGTTHSSATKTDLLAQSTPAGR